MRNGSCINCFAPLGNGSVCPCCGFDHGAYMVQPHQLRPGAMLHGRYIVGRALGQGGFGITYVGFDTSLACKVAVKEYFPEGAALREAAQTPAVSCYPSQAVRDRYGVGLRKCMNEARALAQLGAIPSIVRVQDFFQENGTAYIIMEFVEGVTLNAWLKRRSQRPDYRDAVELMAPVGAALEKIHAKGFVHRDVSPDNIMIDEDGAPKLLDFGAVKAVTTGGSVTENPVVKRGFSPIEMYSTKDKIGPWSDIYAYCATLCYILLGRPPEEPMDRLDDDTVAAGLADAVSPAQGAALLKGLAYRPSQRYQTAAEMTAALNACRNDPAPTGKPAPAPVPTATATDKPAQETELIGATSQETELIDTPVQETELIGAPSQDTVLIEKTVPKQPVSIPVPATERIKVPAPRPETPTQAAAPGTADAAAPRQTDVRAGRPTAPPPAGRKKKTGIILAAVTVFVTLCVVIGVIAAGQSSGKVSTTSTTQAPTTTQAPSTTQAPESESITITPLESAKVGDYVEFGLYEQDNDTTNGKEPIEWLVLAKENGRALLISRYGLDNKKYNEEYARVTWDNCTLRTWLNGTFYKSAFSEMEQDRIVSTTVTADKNPNHNTVSSGNDITDKIFLLSINEANDYFSSGEERKCKATAYAGERGAYVYRATGCCWWWLRSPGYGTDRAADVNYDGRVLSDGNHVGNTYGAVRPALWIDLDS